MSILEVLERLEATPMGVLVRESAWGFPILVATHILGLALSAGLIVWLDLRLLGLSLRNCPISTVYRRLMPWAMAGFALMLVTGGILVIGFATAAYGNTYFRIKMAGLALAGVNALVYHRVTERHGRHGDTAARPWLPARMAGLGSIVLWTIVILAGRMMSYTMF